MSNPLRIDGRLLLAILVGITLLALLMALAVLFVYFIHFRGPLSDQHSVWGTFGDYVGGLLNPAFGFLALVGLLFTIILQGENLRVTAEELELSRKELELTRRELQRSASAQENALDTLYLQVKVTRRAARLAVLGTLVENYEKKVRTANTKSDKGKLERQLLTYLGMLEAEFRTLEREEAKVEQESVNLRKANQQRPFGGT